MALTFDDPVLELSVRVAVEHGHLLCLLEPTLVSAIGHVKGEVIVERSSGGAVLFMLRVAS